MKHIFLILFLAIGQMAFTQELFVYTEPASNVAARSLGLRITQQLAAKKSSNGLSYQLAPEIVWGASARLMLHAEGFFNRRGGLVKADGASLFTKYRFYSSDEVHQHFRMAAFARVAYSRAPVMQEAIDLNGMNSGVEAGAIATKLIDRLAISGTVSLIRAFDNGSSVAYKFPGDFRNAVQYSLSAGRLILPVEYKDYDQVNLNLMLEVLGQTNMESGNSFIDLAPSIQWIIQSRMRVDLGYRFPLVKDLSRPVANLFLLRLEYNIFNAFR